MKDKNGIEIHNGDEVLLTFRGRARLNQDEDGELVSTFGLGWFREDDIYRIEVIPKPLPTKPGLYFARGADIAEATLYSLVGEVWKSDAGGKWAEISEEYVPRELIRFVLEEDDDA